MPLRPIARDLTGDRPMATITPPPNISCLVYKNTFMKFAVKINIASRRIPFIDALCRTYGEIICLGTTGRL